VPVFAGYDHVDCRVRSLAAVEAFYDALMPELGLPRKRFSYVDDSGEWHEASADHRYNAVEFFEEANPDRATFFVGFIERGDHVPGATRVAFRVERSRLLEIESLLERIGARLVERSADFEEYPAVFFEDPAGTKLEIVARAARRLELAG
jgi:catechol 2,3-dioxygenase-like lactoylglutathione lyase family enzyme